MKLIPVIDLLDGQVVHAVAGERNQYRPFVNSRFRFDEPNQLVESLVREFQPEFIYVADLNAIQNRGDNYELLNGLDGFETRFLVDAGFHRWNDFIDFQSKLNESTIWCPVFGTETMDHPNNLAEATKNSPHDYFVSLDLRGQTVLGDNQNPEEVLAQLLQLGFKNVIVLDLDQVGLKRSPRRSWIPDEWLNSPNNQIYWGGGIASAEDLSRLSDAGFAGALSATAIHQGIIRGDLFP